MTLTNASLDYILFGNSVRALLVGCLIAGVVLLFGMTVRRAAGGYLGRIAQNDEGGFNRLVATIASDIRTWMLVVLAISFGTEGLSLPGALQRMIHVVLAAAIAAQILLTSRLLVDFWIEALTRQRLQEDGTPDPAIRSASGIIRFIALVLTASVLLLLLLSNVGVEITPLVTGLGIGGIAVALAAQSILGDLFGSLTILLDRPFLVGDFIVVGDKMGTVENIGVKTTRVRALSGEQLIFSNATLLSEQIRNYQRMRERRVLQVVGVIYETPLSVVREIPEILREAVESSPGVRFDRAHFRSFGAYSLDFEFVYYVRSADYNRYMDIQEGINLFIFQAFQQRRIEFAYPTQLEIRRNADIGQDAGEPVEA